MSGFIKAMPVQAPYPVEAYCTLSQHGIEKVIRGKPACSFRDVRHEALREMPSMDLSLLRDRVRSTVTQVALREKKQ